MVNSDPKRNVPLLEERFTQIINHYGLDDIKIEECELTGGIKLLVIADNLDEETHATATQHVAWAFGEYAYGANNAVVGDHDPEMASLYNMNNKLK